MEWNLMVGLWAENRKGFMIFLTRLSECITRKTRDNPFVTNRNDFTTRENIKLWMDIRRVQKNENLQVWELEERIRNSRVRSDMRKTFSCKSGKL